ncbi:MAG: radical SAM protein [Candidatus Omnitrophica bacterium]|nr:radical SAM protein [Candidatus Omnitrophota bacterium]
MKPKKVLFIYPNINTELRIPLAISILIACIRKAGHQVKLFDTTFMVEDFATDNEAMTNLGTHMPTNLVDMVGRLRKVNIKEEFHKAIKEYSPDLIAASLVERNFPTAKQLFSSVKKEFPDLPVLIGGIMSTIAPELVIREDWVDILCVGEGEHTIVELLNKLDDRNALRSIKNIWTKDVNGKVFSNQLRDLIAMDDVPDQDWSDFDLRHLLKPFMGKVYRGGAFEFSRGCSKVCTFCVAPQLRNTQKGLGKYHRTKTPNVAIGEIEHKVKDYNLNMISFGDTDFLSEVPKDVMKEFLSLYIERIQLPFTIQSGIETLADEEILSLLRKARCCAVSVGVESGSDTIRKNIIKKFVSKEFIKKAFALCRAHELRITANYMIGLPFETEDDVFETIRFNKEINPPSIAVTFFTPFVGTELYDISVKEGFYNPFNIGSNNYKGSPLEMPNLSSERIYVLVKEFVNEFKSYQKDFNIINS